MSATVLVVEDDPAIAAALEAALAGAGFDVVGARTGEAALTLATDRAPSLILLDLGLPDLDGLQLCRRFRADDADRPIVILTARDADIDIVVGLDAGANDYVVKPVSTTVVLARVRAHLRGRITDRDEVIAVGDLRLDPPDRRVTIAGTSVELRPREFAVLELLARQAGRVVTRESILAGLWGPRWDAAANRALDVHVVSLRRKLGDTVEQPRWITTVRGIGYRLDGP